MARKNPTRLEFDALAIEGGLFPAEWLAKVAATEASAQTPADYGVPKGLALRDEIGRYWRIAQALWRDFDLARGTSTGATSTLASRAFLRQFLHDVLGFTDLADGTVHALDGRQFPLGFEALGGRVPFVVGAPAEGLDESVSRHGDGIRRRSAFGDLQEYLNATDAALWGLAANGNTLRLVRDNASLTRPAWVEADLARIFAEERYADFAAFWLLAHASRFGRAGTQASECPLEQWRGECQQQGSRAREALRDGVEAAILALGQGFLAHPANRTLRQALADGTLTRDAYFNELLRSVYRMIFLLTIEERELLFRPDASDDEKRLYAEGYGMRRLRERAVRRSQHDRHGDLWESLRPVVTALGQPDGEPTLGLPGLGGLFAPDQCPHLDDAALDNRGLLGAVYRLAWIREQESGTLARVNWKDMGPEELGSVYESLLELVPVVSDDGRRFSFAGVGESAGNARKLSGSYYTPDELVQQLLDSALEPVVAQRLVECDAKEGKEKVLLSLSVVDPACGSGHFLLAAARRLAGHLARLRAGGTPGAAEYRHALRDVVTHCIHGVDRNPMALELARMALWLEAYTPDRALGFLDHHLVCGDALLGLLDLGAVKSGIPDEAFKPLAGDDKEVSKVLVKLNRSGRKALEDRQKRGQLMLALGTQSLADAFAQLDELSDDGLLGVEAKRVRYAALRAEAADSALALAADLFVSAFLVPKRLASGERTLTEQQAAGRFPTTAALGMALDGTLAAAHPVAAAARRMCARARVLHWPLAFPQVFVRGGFDVVLGNPPWERVKINEQEFFAVRAPHVASAKNKSERERLIAKLEHHPIGSPERSAWQAFRSSKQQSDSSAEFFRAGGRYPLTGGGDINTYSLFAESIYGLLGTKSRAGAVLPTGIMSDEVNQGIFEKWVSDQRLVSLFDFENREALFSSVHRNMRFSLLTLGSGVSAQFAFFLTNVAQILDSRRRFNLTPADFRSINPNTRSSPSFRSAYDAQLARKIHSRVPVLVNETIEAATGNPWGVTLRRMLHMAMDAELFMASPGPDRVPLYEAKMVGQFDHRRGSFEARHEGRGYRVLPETPLDKYQDPTYSITPAYWVSADELEARLKSLWKRGWLLGWKDITAATNERTVVAAVIPRAAVGDTFLLVYPTVPDPRLCAGLLADFNSLVHDYAARQKVSGLHLKNHTKKQVPTLPPSAYDDAALEFVVPRVLELTYTACDLEAWARDLGYGGPPFRWDTERRALLRSELDAWYAHAYGLTREELRYVLNPADVMGPEWPSETFRVLKNNEERQHGEYRTRRLVLEAWDRLFGR